MGFFTGAPALEALRSAEDGLEGQAGTQWLHRRIEDRTRGRDSDRGSVTGPDPAAKKRLKGDFARIGPVVRKPGDLLWGSGREHRCWILCAPGGTAGFCTSPGRSSEIKTGPGAGF